MGSNTNDCSGNHGTHSREPDGRLSIYKSNECKFLCRFGGALIICSAGAAQSLGIPSDKWVFPHAATDGHATYFFSERNNLHESPAIRITSKACLELADITIDDVGPMDLYSCFPSVVQITMSELGIQPDRTTTTTGGLSFFGGPMNSYVIHAIASTVDAVRASEEYGFIHANGGYATKHACAVYSNQPPKDISKDEMFRKRSILTLNAKLLLTQ